MLLIPQLGDASDAKSGLAVAFPELTEQSGVRGTRALLGTAGINQDAGAPDSAGRPRAALRLGFLNSRGQTHFNKQGVDKTCGMKAKPAGKA